MKKKLLYTLILSVISVAVFSGCDNNNEDDFVEKLVLQGDMYIGLPLSVGLSKNVKALDYYDAQSVAVSNAVVKITVNNSHEYVLQEEINRPGRYGLPADSHVVQENTPYSILIVAGGDTLTAATISAAALRIDSCNYPNYHDSSYTDTLIYDQSTDEHYVRWNDSEYNYGYWQIIECMEADWYKKYRELCSNNGPNDINIFSWIIEDNTYLELPWITLAATGRTRVRYFSCDQALWDYARTCQFGIAFNYPVSNVNGGLGVFCAVGADTAYVSIVNPEDCPFTEGGGD